jgi:hypothetical protein
MGVIRNNANSINSRNIIDYNSSNNSDAVYNISNSTTIDKTNITVSGVANAALSNYMPCFIGSDSKIIQASASSQYCNCIITDNADVNDSVEVLIFGTIENASWAFTPFKPIYLNSTGLTQTIDFSLSIIQVIGIAISATEILVNIQNPIYK